MTEENVNDRVKLAKVKVMPNRQFSAAGLFLFPQDTSVSDLGIFSDQVDRLAFDSHKSYSSVISDCRFYFRHDPLAATVINKLVDFSINDLVIDGSKGMKTTEEEIFTALVKDITPFLRKAAREFLLTGLVIPEIRLTRMKKSDLREKGIRRLSSLLYPTSLWVRDSATINIKRPLISEKESYFVVLDDELVYFLAHKGEYPDGTKDRELYLEIIKLYPEFVTEVLDNDLQQVLLENPIIIKGTTTEDSPFPIPYMFSALESLKHKRNLRRMDYSISARVISAILHVTAGNDDYPLTEDQEDVFTDLETQLQWRRNVSPAELERVFALFTNHTVQLEWIFPDVTAMLDNDKYKSVNEDIMVALGFPRILITGETERSFASDPQIATISPLHTMERIRDSLMGIVEFVFREMKKNNRVIDEIPNVKFEPMNLMSMQLFFDGLEALYESGNLSREDYTEAYGFNFKSQQLKRQKNEELIDELGLDPVAPSNTPGAGDPGRPNSAPESS